MSVSCVARYEYSLHLNNALYCMLPELYYMNKNRINSDARKLNISDVFQRMFHRRRNPFYLIYRSKKRHHRWICRTNIMPPTVKARSDDQFNGHPWRAVHLRRKVWQLPPKVRKPTCAFRQPFDNRSPVYSSKRGFSSLWCNSKREEIY